MGWWLALKGSKVGFYAAAIGATIAGAFAVFFAERKKGEAIGKAQGEVNTANAIAGEHDAIAAREVNDARAAAEVETHTVGVANDENRKVAVLPADGDSSAASQLRDRWSRD